LTPGKLRRVLVVAWYFPPTGGPGVQRIVKFCKYLPQYGWEPTVISGVDPDEHQDPSLLEELPEGFLVTRLPPPRTRWQRVRRRLYDHRLGRVGTWIGYRRDFPDSRRDWADAVVPCARDLHRQGPFDAVLTTSYPYSVHVAGMQLKREPGIPWVADLRDPWAENEAILGWLPQWMRRKHGRAQARMAREADAVVCAHPGNAGRLRDRYGLSEECCLCITNGYDPDDYAGFPAPSPPRDGCVTVTHTGSFYAGYTPDALRDALERHWGGPTQPVHEIRFRFVGGTGPTQFPDLPRLSVTSLPRVDHAAALQEQARADVLLAVFDRSVGATNVSGKLFEYLAAGRPILAIAPADGDMARIVRECQAGWVADCDDAEGIVRTLLEATSAVATPGYVLQSNRAEIGRYSRVELTGRLAGVLRSVCAKSP